MFTRIKQIYSDTKYLFTPAYNRIVSWVKPKSKTELPTISMKVRHEKMALTRLNSHLTSLPDEILIMILSHAELQSYFNLSLTNHLLHFLADDHFFWKMQISIYFSYLKELGSEKFNNQPKMLFMRECKRYKKHINNWQIKMSDVMRVLKGDIHFIQNINNQQQREDLYTIALTRGYSTFALMCQLGWGPSESQVIKAMMIAAQRGNISALLELSEVLPFNKLDSSNLEKIIYNVARFDRIDLQEKLINALPYNSRLNGYGEWFRGAFGANHINTAQDILEKHLISLFQYFFRSSSFCLFLQTKNVILKDSVDAIQLLLDQRYLDHIEPLPYRIDRGYNNITYWFQYAAVRNKLKVVKLLLSTNSSRIQNQMKNKIFISSALTEEPDLFNLLFASLKNEVSLWTSIKAMLGSGIYGNHKIFFTLLWHNLKEIGKLGLNFLFFMGSLHLSPLALFLSEKIGISLISTFILEEMKGFHNYFTRGCYEFYKAKTDIQLEAHSHQQLQAFDIGYQSAKSLYQRVLAFGSWNNYRHFGDYCAGFEAKKHEDKALKCKIRIRLRNTNSSV